MDGGSGAPRKAHAEDCLSAKSATVADVREFHRRAEGGLRRARDGGTSKRRKTVKHTTSDYLFLGFSSATVRKS